MSPGLQVGWLVAEAFLEQTEYLKYVSNLATPPHTQLTAAKMLAKGGYDRQLRQVRNRYRQAVERMTAAIDVYFPRGTRVTRPEGGFVFWVELPTSIDAMALSQQALAQGISISRPARFSRPRKNTGILSA